MLLQLSVFSTVAIAHSWLHCSDYRGDVKYFEEDKCFGHPRPLGGGLPAAQAFGQDIGFDEQRNPGDTSQCHAPQTDPLANFPAARYKQGATIRLAWPSKNHVAAPCTNPYIPDTSLELFFEPYGAGADPAQFTKVVEASFSTDPHENGKIDYKGFQNCPAFCENNDKSLCTGTFTVPNVPDGMYTFQWRWVFNAGTPPYVTCFDAYIGADVVPGVLPTPAPTEVGEVVPTPSPTEGSNCLGLYANCSGGQCCSAPAKCQKQSEYYAQCLPDCPEGWACDLNPETPAPVPNGGVGNGGGNDGGNATPAPVVGLPPNPTPVPTPFPTLPNNEAVTPGLPAPGGGGNIKLDPSPAAHYSFALAIVFAFMGLNGAEWI